MKNKLILTENRIFYCLKHLKKVNKQTSDYLIDKGHTIAEIQQQIELIGSKFFSIFCQSPRELYDKITDRVLSSKEQNTIVLEKRNHYEVKVIRKNKRNATKQLNVVFRKNSNEIITMFPGIYAPPLPSEVMNIEELLRATEFWENYVFID